MNIWKRDNEQQQQQQQQQQKTLNYVSSESSALSSIKEISNVKLKLSFYVPNPKKFHSVKSILSTL